jgi:hypothetical protein
MTHPDAETLIDFSHHQPKTWRQWATIDKNLGWTEIFAGVVDAAFWRKAGWKMRNEVVTKNKSRLERTHTALNKFKIVMPNCYAKPFKFSEKTTISFIINRIIKVVRARGFEPPILAEPDPKSGVSAIPPRARARTVMRPL